LADGEGAAQVFKEVKISFEEFEESFNRYADRLKETEGLWRSKQGIWKSMAGGASQMEASMGKLQKSTKGWAGELENVAKNLTSIGGQWNNLQRLMRGGFGAIYRGGKSLSSGEDVGALASAAGTAAKAFGVAGLAVTSLATAAIAASIGIYKLAQEGAGRGRRAAGFGADVGSMTAAEIYMNRWVNPDAAMANAAQGRFDITSPQYVAMRAGLGMKGSFEGRETGQLSREMIEKTAAIMHQGSDRTALATAHARGLGSLFSDEELIRLRQSNEKTLQEYIKEAESKKSQYELTQEEIDAENKLITEISSLEATFTTQVQKWMQETLPLLTRVASGLEGLIKSIDGWTTAIPKWLDAPAFPDDEGDGKGKDDSKWGDPIGKGWEWFKKHIPDEFSPMSSAHAGELAPGSSPNNPLMVQDKPLMDLINQNALDAAGGISTAGVAGLTGGTARESVGLHTSGRGGGGSGNAEKIGEIDLHDPEAKAGNYKDAMTVMMKAGLTRNEAAGLAGEFTAETQLGTMYGGKVLGENTGDSGAASGMAQWHRDRWNPLVQWARSQGLDPAKPSTQYKMAAHEWITRWRAKHGAAVDRATTPAGIEAATQPFEGNASGPGRGAAISGVGRALREGPTGPQSMNDLSGYQGAHPSHFVKLNVNNQAGANVIVQGGMLGAGNGQFQVA
jgi:hypothetical protein